MASLTSLVTTKKHRNAGYSMSHYWPVYIYLSQSYKYAIFSRWQGMQTAKQYIMHSINGPQWAHTTLTGHFCISKNDYFTKFIANLIKLISQHSKFQMVWHVHVLKQHVSLKNSAPNSKIAQSSNSLILKMWKFTQVQNLNFMFAIFLKLLYTKSICTPTTNASLA